MTKDEKESDDIETSQTDVPVDSQSRVEPEGQQNQPTANLPQQSASPEAGSSQACSERHAERNFNVIENRNEDLIEELPSQSSPEVGSDSVQHSVQNSVRLCLAEFYSIIGRCRSRLGKFFGPYFDNLTNDLFRLGTGFTVASILLMTEAVISECLVHSLLAITAIFTFISFFERGGCYSTVTEHMAKLCPCFVECCIETQTPHRPSQFYHSIDTDTTFEHEVADMSSGEMPRMVYRNEESDISHSTERPESPKVVDVDVYADVEAPRNSGGASGFSPSEGGACGFTPVEEGAFGYSPLEGGAYGFTPVEEGASGYSPPEGGASRFTSIEGGAFGYSPPKRDASRYSRPPEGGASRYSRPPPEGSASGDSRPPPEGSASGDSRPPEEGASGDSRSPEGGASGYTPAVGGARRKVP